MDCYYYQWHTPDFCWLSFDADAQLYRIGYGGLLKAAALFFSELLPTLRTLIKGRDPRRIGWCAPYFAGVDRLSAAGQDELEKLLSTLERFFAFFADWMVQVTRTIPPTMRPAREEETLAEDAAAAYRKLIQTRARLQMTGDPGREGLAEARAAAQADCDRLLRQIGGESWLELLYTAQQNCADDLRRQDRLVAEQEEAVYLLARQPSAPAVELRRKQERLDALRLLRDELALRLHLTDEDARAALQAELPIHYPAPASVRRGELPRNSLLDAELMNALHRLLKQHHADPAEQDAGIMNRCSLQLQKGLNKLVFAYNEVTALPAFPEDAMLVTIDGSHNLINSLEPLGKLQKLNNVLMDYNAGLESLKPLDGCPLLVMVNAYGTKVKEVTFLTQKSVIVNFNPSVS
jgi:hypothetical protein